VFLEEVIRGKTISKFPSPEEYRQFSFTEKYQQIQMTNILKSGGLVMNDTHHVCYIVYCTGSLHRFSHDIPLHSSQFSQKAWHLLPPHTSLNPRVLWLLLCLSSCSGWSSSCCICCRESCCSTKASCRQLLSCERGVRVAEVSSCHGCISL